MASDGYAFGRGYVEATRYRPSLPMFEERVTDVNAFDRLQCQHYLWKETLSYLIHPSIPMDGKGLKIADVGTGTG